MKVEHSTVKIQSNFTAPQKSGKLSGKKSGVRKSSTDTPTHSRKVEEKRKSEEKVSPRNEEEAKLADKVNCLVLYLEYMSRSSIALKRQFIAGRKRTMDWKLQ